MKNVTTVKATINIFLYPYSLEPIVSVHNNNSLFTQLILYSEIFGVDSKRYKSSLVCERKRATRRVERNIHLLRVETKIDIILLRFLVKIILNRFCKVLSEIMST